MRLDPNDIYICGNLAYMDVSTRKHPKMVATFDASQAEHVAATGHRWAAGKGGYVWTQHPMKTSLHRWIMRAASGQMIDHRNHNKLDNRFENLRFCTTKLNAANARRHRRSTNPYKGIRRNGRGWDAMISIDGTPVYLGQYWTPEDAAYVYDCAALLAFGEYALTNGVAEQSNLFRRSAPRGVGS